VNVAKYFASPAARRSRRRARAFVLAREAIAPAGGTLVTSRPTLVTSRPTLVTSRPTLVTSRPTLPPRDQRCPRATNTAPAGAMRSPPREERWSRHDQRCPRATNVGSVGAMRSPPREERWSRHRQRCPRTTNVAGYPVERGSVPASPQAPAKRHRGAPRARHCVCSSRGFRAPTSSNAFKIYPFSSRQSTASTCAQPSR
jgi:hypothetical protein